MSLLLILLALSVHDEGAVKDFAWLTLTRAAEEARAENKPILVYVHAPWCGPCLKMENEVFPEVETLLKRFALAGLDYDDNETSIKAYGNTHSPFEWAIRYGAEATPTFILLTPTGAVVTWASGFIDTRGFSLLLAYVATKAYIHTSFKEYAASIQP